MTDTSSTAQYLFQGTEVLVRKDDGITFAPLSVIADDDPSISSRGTTAARESRPGGPDRLQWVEVTTDYVPPKAYTFVTLRSLFPILPDEDFLRAGRAYQVMDFRRNTRYCGRCSGPMRPSRTEEARICGPCGRTIYPILAPAVIVAIEKEGRILLARGHHHPSGRYSVLAGFVEPGETLEEAVHREVREEVGISITDLTYFGSQPWPFPHSLMVGFTAKWKDGEIAVDGREIADAGWFSPADMPPIPPPRSISGGLIGDFLKRHAKP